MMKKITKFLIPLIAILGINSLTSCKQDVFTGKVHLDYGEYKETPITLWTELFDLQYQYLDAMVSDKESFMLAIYGDEHCGCWTSFSNNLIKYYNETHTRVYIIAASEFDDVSNTFGLYTVPSKMPSLAFFSRGRLVYQTVYGKDGTETFEKYAKMVDFINSKSIAPKIYYVSMETLDSFITNNKSFKLYISLTSCPDCSSLRNNFLHSWIDSTTSISEPLYAFDCYGHNLQEMKDKYGLSYTYNNLTGWNNGYVPSIQVRTGSTINDMITVYNDKYDAEEHKVISYFNQSRVANLPFLEDATITKILDGLDVYKTENEFKSKYSSEYVIPIIKLFFETYIK